MTRLHYSVHPILTQSIQVSISRRVGGDPPRTSFLAFGAKIGSSVGVKSHHFGKRTGLAARCAVFSLVHLR